MEIKLTLKSNNETLEIGNDTSYKLVNIDGIDSGSLELNTVSNAQFDGSVVVSKRIQNRPISITVDYKGTNSQEIERQNLISFFNPKNKGLLIVNYGDIERAIEYEVEGFNCKLNSIFDTVSFTVDLLCPQPYWRDILESKINIAMWRGMFHFPLIMPSTIVPHSNPDTTWKDLSGNLNNGLLSGFNYDTSSGWTTEGLKFDSDSYVTLPSLDMEEGTIQVNNQVITFDKDTDYRTTSANSNIVSLNTTVDGIMDFEIGGNTLQNLLPKVTFLDTAKTYTTSSTTSVSLVAEALSSYLLKPNTEYTIIFKINYANKTSYNYFQINYQRIDDTSVALISQPIVYASGSIYKIKVNTDANIKKLVSVFLGGKEGSVDILTGGYCMILEGDWTNKEVPYFEGIKSVGEGENLELVSCGKNLFNNYSTLLKKGFYFSGVGVYTPSTNSVLSESYIKIDNTKNYTWNGFEKNIIIATYNFNKSFIERLITYSSPIINSIKFKEDVEYIRVSSYEKGVEALNDFQLEEGTISTPLEPYKEHRQTLTLTNPLRGLSNNVRDVAKGNVVTRNVGKVVLNGSENWSNGSNELTNTLRFQVTIPNATSLLQLISNFPVLNRTTYDYDFENMQISASGNLIIRVLKSKLTTPDTTGFKAWLQANPVTVYYQLATPTTENLAQNLKLKSFSSGTLQINTLIPPYLSAYYPITLGGSLASNVSKIDLSNPLITTGKVKNYRVYNKILTTEEVARANTTNYLRGPSLLVDLNSSHKELSKTGIIMGLREPSLIVNALNTGNVESGMIIEFKALGTLTNPSILNVETQEFFKVNKSMVQGEVITVNTNVGAKKVIDNLNGVETNILNLIDLDSTFLQLRVGDNLLRYDADTNLDNLEVNIYYNPFYLGV